MRNLNIGKIYKEVVSGETISERKEMQKLLKDVENEKWTGVLVVEVERLARGDTADQGRVQKLLNILILKLLHLLKLMIQIMNLMRNILNLDYLCLEENIKQ